MSKLMFETLFFRDVYLINVLYVTVRNYVLTTVFIESVIIILITTLLLDRTNDQAMGNLFGSLGRPGNNQDATTESIPVVRYKAYKSKKEAGCYNSSGNSFVQACKRARNW